MKSARADTAPDPTTGSAAARGRQRWRWIWRAAAGAAAFRAVSVTGTFITVPLILAQLGSARFGVLVLITQLTMLLVFSDLGLGNGLVSALARALAVGDRPQARGLVSSTWFLLLAITAAGGALFGLLSPFLDWPRLLGVEGVGDRAVTSSVVVFAVIFLVGVPASLAQKIHLALQEGWQANAWQTLGALVTIGATVACVLASAGLPWFVAAAAGGSVGSATLNCLWLFVRRPELRPRWRDVRPGTVRLILGSGLLFLVLGVAGSVAYQTDALVISHLLGPEEVTTYNLAFRLFMIPGLAVSFLVAPLWPAFSDALARDDEAWARRTFRRAVLWGAAATVPVALLLVLTGQRLVDLWVGEGAVRLSPLLLVAFGAWTALNAVQGPLAMLLNGAQVVRFQIVCAVTMAVANIGLSIAFTHWLGVAGPVIATVLAQTALITVPALVYVSRMWKK